MSNIYTDQTYLQNNPGWHEEDAAFKVGKIKKLLARNSFSLRNVAEVGCGSGAILELLAKEYLEASFAGFDISPDAIAIATKKQAANLHFRQADIGALVGQNTFQLVMLIDVIEHVENYFSFLDDARKLANYTLIHVPLDMSLWSLFSEGMLIESKARVGHIHHFTESFFESVLADKGFTLIDKMYTEPIDEAKTFKQKLVNGLRQFLFFINKRFATKTIGGYSLLLLLKNKE